MNIKKTREQMVDKYGEVVIAQLDGKSWDRTNAVTNDGTVLYSATLTHNGDVLVAYRECSEYQANEADLGYLDLDIFTYDIA